MGDIHGAFKALRQCLERAPLDKDENGLLQLEDVADGLGEVYNIPDQPPKTYQRIAGAKFKGIEPRLRDRICRHGPSGCWR